MATIWDVAAEANVSISTVSRVINNNPNVSREKKERVLAAIEAVGYSAQLREKSEDNEKAVPKKGGVILVVSTIIHDPLCTGIRENASELGYDVLFNFIGENSETAQRNMAKDTWQLLSSRKKLSGIILLNPMRDAEVYSDPIFAKYPSVQIGTNIHGNNEYFVGTDDFKAARDITERLIEYGYRNIAFVTSDTDIEQLRYSFIIDRFEGYCAALARHGIPLREENIIHTATSSAGGCAAARRIMNMQNRPDAVFCVTDPITQGTYVEFIKNGLRVPEDIGLVGFQAGYDSCISLFSEITSVVQSLDEITFEGVKLLDSMIKGDTTNGRTTYVAYHIHEGSTIIKHAPAEV